MRGNRPDLRAVALLLPLLLTACAHKKPQVLAQQPLAPPVEDQPPQQPNNAPANLPPPVITIPQQTEPAQTHPPQTAAAPAPAPQKPVRHHRKAAAKAPGEAGNTERASNGDQPEVSAIGQLSSGDPQDLRRQTAGSIAATQQKLDKIHRTLSSQEQKTAAQIREFLKEARAALNSGDADGAYTLALKAKVLVDELSQ